ncbi:O-antigen ligase family protein [Pseudotamlana agarivorans]|uniref:O-antigen ligase family protein n=1 Tax=Pseudotamlana agarivorans TaxID=481183 RepID=UPI00082D0E97|nr:O-antigen ligase family protein [Tamlana agarivorans]
MISLKSLSKTLFFTGLFFLPFNSNVPSFFMVLGEYGNDSSPIFFLLSFIFLLTHDLIRSKLRLPLNSILYALFLIFVCYALFVSFLNISQISSYYFKQTSGFERLFKQLISVILSGVIFFYVFYNICYDYGVTHFFKKTRKVFLASLIVVSIYGFLEFFIINLGAESLTSVLSIFDFFPFVKVHLDYNLGRISSTTYEPPALGSFLITISGFMFSYILTSVGIKKFVPFLLVVILAFLTKSRTAFVVIIIQILVGVYFAYKESLRFRSILTKGLISSSILVIIVIIFNGKKIAISIEERLDSLNFVENTKYGKSDNAVSNKSRLGIQYAMFQAFLRNPLTGTGWGQQTYVSKQFYPEWAVKNNYEFRESYLNEEVKSFPPGYNMYLRVLAETGIFGFFIFMLFLITIILSLLKQIKNNKKYNYITMSLNVAFIGCFFNWLQIDSFRLYGFWICLAILILLQKKNNEQYNSINSALQQ